MENSKQPAFPLPHPDLVDASRFQGLSKREYFAIMIAQGICSNIYDEKGDKSLRDTVVANESIRIADEILKQLK